MFRRLIAFGLGLGAASVVLAANPSAGDSWLTNFVQFPPPFSSNTVRGDAFESLHAEVAAGQLQILCKPGPAAAPLRASVWYSADAPGHWPARDWHSRPMEDHAGTLQTTLPVDSLHVPLIYFLKVASGGRTNLSPMRLCDPRALGLEEPSRIFWAFLDGFEDGLESWRRLSAGGAELETDSRAHTGKAALKVRLAAGEKAVAVATTRLRGWFALEHGATGVSMWLRTRSGAGRAHFMALAHSGATNEVVAAWTGDVNIGGTWQKVELPFSRLPRLPRAGLDLMVIEFIGEPPCDFLIDDLELLGPWAPVSR